MFTMAHHGDLEWGDRHGIMTTRREARTINSDQVADSGVVIQFEHVLQLLRGHQTLLNPRLGSNPSLCKLLLTNFVPRSTLLKAASSSRPVSDLTT